jgi:hypothetical protein
MRTQGFRGPSTCWDFAKELIQVGKVSSKPDIRRDTHRWNLRCHILQCPSKRTGNPMRGTLYLGIRSDCVPVLVTSSTIVFTSIGG